MRFASRRCCRIPGCWEQCGQVSFIRCCRLGRSRLAVSRQTLLWPRWNLVPSAFDPDKRQPIWWNDAVVVYAPRGGVAPIMAPWDRAPNFGVRISEVAATGGRMTFAATFSDRASDQWTGQDWLVTAGDGSPWALPRAANTAGRQREASAQWYAGQLVPGLGTKVHRYVFDPSAATLAVRSGDDASVEAASSGRPLTAGEWTLAVRLRREWHEVAFVSSDEDLGLRVGTGVVPGV